MVKGDINDVTKNKIAFPYHLLSVLMKIRWFEHIMKQRSLWLLLLWTLALWPCQCSHPQLSWKTTNRLLACVLWSHNPTPGTFLQPILCSVPAAPGSVRRCGPTRPTYPSFGFKGTDPIRHTVYGAVGPKQDFQRFVRALQEVCLVFH